MDPSSGNRVLVIGGGIIGLASALFLSRKGFAVTLVDRDASGRESCSRQNAGMIVPSHFIPLAAPGVALQGLKWMLNRGSPFAIRPRASLSFASWCWRFWRHCTERHVEQSKELLRDLSLESRRLFAELTASGNVELAQRGLLMLCQSDHGLAEESEVAEAARKIGIEAEVCDRLRVHQIDPACQMEVRGGVWFPQDCHLDPRAFLRFLGEEITRHGGEFITAEVADFVKEKNRLRAAVLSGEKRAAIDADNFVITGGAWAGTLARRLGLVLPIEGGKGYSLTLENPARLPTVCSLLKEGRVAVTPMAGRLRVAGTMELGARDLSINSRRIEGIVASFCRFFPEFKPSDFAGIAPWSGLRPCSPDGLPYLGPARGFRNAWIAAGHAMLGLSLGPVSGELIARLVAGEKPGFDLEKLSPGRFH